MKVCIVGSGGTISSLGHGSLDYVDYGDTGQKLDPAGLLERFPEVAAAGEVIPVTWRAIGSPDIDVPDWLELLALLHALPGRHPGLDGIVLTHGTSTLEETAYFLHLALKLDIPVVLVGAQRPASAFGSDAGANLRNAVRVAGSAEARGMGVLVVLNDEIQSARDVTKTSILRVQTFRTPDFGLLGYADPDRVLFYRKPTRAHAPDTEFSVEGAATLPRVDIVSSYAGADAVAIEAYLAAGARGLVLAGLAPGMVAPRQREPLDRAAAAGIPVIMSTRSMSGRVVPRAGLRNRGWLAADTLSPQKARILLMLGLTVTSEPERLQAMFDRY
ncbi:L-asparaginase [Stella humosa]|uniref:L-asparaginase n=1 Tax=Stella humosa TaxID=94 RepID=A0A3N1M895_9PROT|nr:asparaginase [Stella humosa]ROP99917.1 L-asparaginase [Stella humosa]BBK30853.1 L-asparaginase [Stella humosa]